MDVREILAKLPVDIVRHIIPYTYSCQSPELLQDIRSFYSTRIKPFLIQNALSEGGIE